MKTAQLSDAELLASVQKTRYATRRLDVRLLVLLGEVEERRLHLKMACSSLFDFCRKKLQMSEGEASRRMVAARLVRKLPSLTSHIEMGRVSLTTLTMLRDFLTVENVDALVDATKGRTKNEVKELLAALAPRSDVPPRMRKIQASTSAGGEPATVASGGSRSSTNALDVPSNARVEPLAPARYKLEMTIGVDMRDKLQRARDLMRHRLPDGDLAAIFGEALSLLVTKLEKERLGAVAPRKPKIVNEEAPPGKRAPKAAPAATTRSNRYIPRSVRRAVFARDGERCTFTDDEGNRCPATAFLELDHTRAAAWRGGATVENLRVLCQAHNRLHAEEDFGKAHVARHIDAGRRRRRTAGSGVPNPT